MPPPIANPAAPRFLLGPALRSQPDRRLVGLVREGYENAFEEIVRRYERVLGRYAAAIVPNHRAEDVTQDAFSKALLALRGSENEIELRPWLYRIVRNTALNDLRDQPAAASPLLDSAEAPGSVADQIERREELKDLMKQLRALPDAQRAAIVMRELEGLSHEEIAAALGISGGAARQAIHRAREGLRSGAALLFPLPLMRWLLAGGPGLPADAASGGVGGALAGAAGGAGTGVALKAAAATVLVAGSLGTGVALHQSSSGHPNSGQRASHQAGADRGATPPSRGPELPVAVPAGEDGSGRSGEENRSGSDGGSGEPGDESSGSGSSGEGSGPGSGTSGSGESSGSGSGDGGSSDDGGSLGETRSGDQSGSGSHDGSGSGGSSGSGSGSLDDSGGFGTSGGSGSGALGETSESGDGGGTSGSGSGTSGSGTSGSGSTSGEGTSGSGSTSGGSDGEGLDSGLLDAGVLGSGA